VGLYAAVKREGPALVGNRTPAVQPETRHYSNVNIWWSEFLASNPEVPGSILDATRFSDRQWIWNGVHSALVRINEELLERKVTAPV
jgi:hypothetical protein